MKQQKKEYIYNHPSQRMTIKSIGIQTAKFQSILYWNEKVILPVTCSLILYNSYTLQKESELQTNQSAIYSLNQDEQYIYSIGYGGDIAKIEKKTFKIITQINYNIGCQCRWNSICGNLMAYTAEYSMNKGFVQVIDLDKMENVKTFDGQYCYGTIVKKQQQIFYYVLKEYKYNKLSKEEKSKLSEKQLRLKKNNQKYLYCLEIFDEDQKIIKELKLPEPESVIILMAQCSDYLAYVYQDRRIVYIDLNTDNLDSIKVEGTGSLYSGSFYDNKLLISPKSKEIHIYDLSTKQVTIEKVPQLTNAIQGMLRIKENNQLITILTTESEIIIKRDENTIIKEFGGITKCGIDFLSEDIVVTGDFEGYCTIDNVIQQVNQKIYIGVPIRCITCQDNIIYIGTMDGCIYTYKDETLEQFDNIQGSITNIRVNQKQVLVSTTNGIIGLYQKDRKNLFKFLAHPPQEKSELFPSLDLFADIWSCTFHPTKESVYATASEDQQVKVFEGDKQIIALKEHRLAVTCVDWRENSIGCMLYSCSDDRTVNMFNSQFELVHKFNTFFINEWHTLTYMRVLGDIIAIGAQNGYFYVYDLIKKQFVVAQKVHMGGIEGLSGYGQKLCTCSSDDSELRKKYEKDLKNTSLLSRKVMLNYYESQLKNKSQYLEYSLELKIPKIEISYRSDLKSSDISLNKSSVQDCYFLERLAELKQIHQVQLIVTTLKELSQTLNFVQKRIVNRQKQVFSALIVNFNKQVQKQQYQRVVQLYTREKQEQMKFNLFRFFRNEIFWKKQILKKFQIRRVLKQWKEASKEENKIYLFRLFEEWREYCQNKKYKKIYKERRVWQCFIYWKFKCQRSKTKILQILEAKEHYKDTLKLKVLKGLRINYNEFLTNDL